MNLNFKDVGPNTARIYLAVLDADCFPHDVPPEWDSAHWMVAMDKGRPAAYCAWRQESRAGFLYRAGVAKAYRGQGVQRQMIALREGAMKAAKLPLAVTYTDADNAASMRNLIAEGYLPYDPDTGLRLSGPAKRLGRCGFVHWEKKL